MAEAHSDYPLAADVTEFMDGEQQVFNNQTLWKKRQDSAQRALGMVRDYGQNPDAFDDLADK